MTETSSNNKRIAKNTLALYVRMFLMMIIALYTSRVVLDVLGTSDFGIYNIVCGVVTMFTFINGTLATGTQRFLNFSMGSGDEEKDKRRPAANVTPGTHCTPELFGELASDHIQLHIPVYRESVRHETD